MKVVGKRRQADEMEEYKTYLGKVEKEKNDESTECNTNAFMQDLHLEEGLKQVETDPKDHH